MLRYGLSQSYLNGGMLRNFSLNLCWATSNVADFLRMLATSVACRGATCCFTWIEIFLVLFHCSGSSCKQGIQNSMCKMYTYYCSIYMYI